jgi:hypothetical protein
MTMTMEEAIKTRHTIRTYDGRALAPEIARTLQSMIAEINRKAGLHFQLMNGIKDALAPYTIRYGKWTGVTNYISLVGKVGPHLDEQCGYYGEQLVLWAQQHGLKTGWVETRLENPAEGIPVPEIAAGERLVITICIGYSEATGSHHKIKTAEEMSETSDPANVPDWFRKGMACAILAPTAGNQQLFKIHLNGETLSIDTVPGFLEKVDLGIAKYHFELGSGIDHSRWE